VFTPRELARLPPFPFPKELFPPGAPAACPRLRPQPTCPVIAATNMQGPSVTRPAAAPPGTFPHGMRFSSKGLRGMPPQVSPALGVLAGCASCR
jgi:hypothetical protein